MGKAGVYLKITLLLGALVLVFMGMRSLTPEKVQGAFEALGVEPGAAGSPGLQPGGSKLAEGEVRRTLCRTRVHAVHFPDGRTVVEHKKGLDLNWVAEERPAAEIAGSAPGTIPTGAPTSSRVLNYLAVEKWFSLHCQFTALPQGPSMKALSEGNLEPSNEPKKLVLVEFIDKTQIEFYLSDDILSGTDVPSDRFKSPDLLQALEELRAIAGFPVDIKDR